MPAVNFEIQWPDGQISSGYSPSTIIHDYLAEGVSYPLSDFMQRAESGLNAASERVRTVYGYACSSAMDCLYILQEQAKKYSDPEGQITLLRMRQSP